MNLPASVAGNFVPLPSNCGRSCCELRLFPSVASPVISAKRGNPRRIRVGLVCHGKREVVCRVAEGETESDKEKVHEGDEMAASTEVHEGDEMAASTDSTAPVADQGQTTETGDLVPGNDQGGDKEKAVHEDGDIAASADSNAPVADQGQTTEIGEIVPGNDQGGDKDGDNVPVASGSPLPGVKPQQFDESMRMSKETIDILKEQVFGFDTFFVTSQEPYEAGVLFKGNLRGQAAKSFEKITRRLENKFADQYKVFLLVNPEDDKPVAVVVPKRTLQPEATAVPEWLAAGAFGLVSIFTLFLRNVPALQSNILSTLDNPGLLKDGLPGALVTALILGVHEISHILVAKDAGIKLGIPYFVPSWQIGSFGAITRIVNIVPKREDLLKVAAAGPAAGFSLGLFLLFLGFILPPSDGLGVVVDSSVFHESLLVGSIAKLLFGEALKESAPISVNPLVIWAWAGLLINAINSIPAGELDGGRIAFAIWGRKVSARFTGVAIALLGLSSLFNDVAFYWVALIFFLQRGPIAPLSEEISDPDDKYVALGIGVMLIGLLVCLPYPFPFTSDNLTSF